jgi:hypothetical protein
MKDDELFDLDLWGKPIKPPILPDWFSIGSTVPRTHTSNVVRGLHPFGHDLGPETSRCRTCKHVTRRQYASSYLKCAKSLQSSGLATDVRLKWRGCVMWEENTP